MILLILLIIWLSCSAISIMMSLTFVRMFLGQDDLGATMRLSKVLKDPEIMTTYVEWLIKNKKELDAMVNLPDSIYDPNEIPFSDEELLWIKSRQWYIENDNIETCISESIKGLETDSEILKATLNIVELSKNDPNNIAKFKQYTEESKKYEKIIKTRKKLNSWLSELDKDKSIWLYI